MKKIIIAIFTLLVCIMSPAVFAVDTDNDGVDDVADNCTLVNNPVQRDTDGDGYGNFCDPVFNQDYMTNGSDLFYMKSMFFTSDPDADLNGDGTVSFGDYFILEYRFFTPPGPSCCGTLE